MPLPAPEKIVITADDIRLIEDFFSHFNDPKLNNLLMSESLKSEIDVFKKKGNEYNVSDQTRLRTALCESFSKTTHKLLRDQALAEVLTSTEEVYNDAKFYEDLEKVLAEKPSQE